jgi:hypothetical protein
LFLFFSSLPSSFSSSSSDAKISLYESFCLLSYFLPFNSILEPILSNYLFSYISKLIPYHYPSNFWSSYYVQVSVSTTVGSSWEGHNF